MAKSFEKPAFGIEKEGPVEKQLGEIAGLALERAADIDKKAESGSPEIKNAAQKTKEAILYYTRLVVLGGLALSAGGDTPASQAENPAERLARARLELKTKGTTSEQRRTYKPIVSDLLQRGVTPFSYNLDSKIRYLLPNLIKGRGSHKALRHREDAWRFYLGLPQKDDTFEISDYRPSQSKEDKYYYKIKNFWEKYFAENGLLGIDLYKDRLAGEIIKYFLERIQNTELKKMVDEDTIVEVMGRFNVSAGQDERGSYIAYYDKWDLDGIPLEKDGLIGKPFEIYDRLYYNPVTFQPLNFDKTKFEQKIQEIKNLGKNIQGEVF